MDEGTKMFIIIFSLLFALLIGGALVAKFHFGRNLTDLCLYQWVIFKVIISKVVSRPCAGNYNQKRQKQYSPPTENANRDPFRPDWGDISSPQGPPPKIEMPVRPIKNAKTAKPAAQSQPFADPFKISWGEKTQKPPKPPKPSLKPEKPVFADPFQVDWGDTSDDGSRNWFYNSKFLSKNFSKNFKTCEKAT